ncbi:MAG: HAD-IA family hydrolase [Devosiaceae bacterium]|nr:HAD-IA family hydrolase [Devosiaceae bacterium MH13]
MKAVFFGSIGTLVETSELQRNCFNQAFREHGLDWHWDRETYRDMLAISGGKARVARFAETHGAQVDAGAVHATKVALFHKGLAEEKPPARAGVAAVIGEAKNAGLKLALVSTTDKAALDLVLRNTPELAPDRFDLVMSSALGLPQKPSPSAYHHALGYFDLAAAEVTAIEDNAPGAVSAKAAGLRVVAYPGANTADQDYGDADLTVTGDLKSAVFG